MSKQFWGIVAVVILVLVGIFYFTGNKPKTSGNSGSGGPSNHVIGNTSSNVALVEYGDYQCPYCGEFYPVVKQVQTEFSNQMSFQFVNFPLVSLHQNAFAASRAAEAAALQGKFWEMHDLLYQENEVTLANSSANTWVNASDPTTYFNQYAQQLGLNVTKFKSDYASSQVNDTINADMSKGNALNVQGTPSFFLNGKQIEVGQASTAQPVFEQLIKAAIAKKAASASSSTTTSSTAQTKK